MVARSGLSVPDATALHSGRHLITLDRTIPTTKSAKSTKEERKTEFDALSNRVIGCALEVHRELGPGLLESTYEQCLAHELSLANLDFKVQHILPVKYKDVLIECGYRIDVLVQDGLIVEIKSVERILPIHEAQSLTYMKLSGIHTGILMNFNVKRLKDGLKRMVL